MLAQISDSDFDFQLGHRVECWDDLPSPHNLWTKMDEEPLGNATTVSPLLLLLLLLVVVDFLVTV